MTNNQEMAWKSWVTVMLFVILDAVRRTSKTYTLWESWLFLTGAVVAAVYMVIYGIAALRERSKP